jgi:hypothetical protein
VVDGILFYHPTLDFVNATSLIGTWRHHPFDATMNWTECEKAVADILRLAYEQSHGEYDTETRDTFVALAESNITSFINEHFGLKPDKTLDGRPDIERKD